MAKHPSGGSTSWESSSSLKSGAERFLSQVVHHALENGFRTPEDFLRAFKPLELMESLEAAPELRKDILVMAAGMHEKIARRKSTQSASEDLRIALDEGVTTAADVLEVLQPDDRVRYLNRPKLLAFAVEDSFYSHPKSGSEHEKAVDRLLFILEAALAEKLVSLSDVASSLGFDAIAHRLPLNELQRAIEHALTLGKQGEAFSEQALFDIVPLRSLLSYVPMDQVWNRVVVAKVLAPADLIETDGKVSFSPPPDSGRTEGTPSSRRVSAKEPPPKPIVTNGKKAVEEPKPARSESRSSENEVDSLLEGAGAKADPAEDEARKKVMDRLQAMKRLPPRHGELSIPILLSIDSMYAELLEASNDEAREECIRDSFPNEQHMTQALLALIELLDPSIDVTDPVIRDADIDSLIKVVLFEERHRYEQAHPSQRPAPSAAFAAPPPASGQTAVPPLPPAARRTMPPPLPRSSSPTPPPLPPSANAEKQR